MQVFHKYNGFINIYKEAGWTSMDVCAKLKHVLGVRKIGHAGTLDPMAEGVLPVALGRATKDIDKVGSCVKEYTAGMLLGTETDTEDISGKVLKTYEGELPSEAEVREAVMSFVGEYDQLTPMYSARKVNGRKLYQYARAGIEVERKTKHVEIYGITIDEINLPHVTFTVRCSQGTYVRSLCRDIGEKLGCGACMDKLTRNQVGRFVLNDAVRIAEVENLEQAGGIDAWLSISAPTAVSIGKFDGTHIGHQALFRELRKKAEAEHLRTLVIILKFGKSGVLSDADRKQRLYELGIDYVVELEFNEEMRNMSAEDFLEKILIGRYNMHAIVAGKDVSFGKGKAGNAEFLKANAAKYGYSVDLIDKILAESPDKGDNVLNGQIASSTLLRKLIAEGDMARVAELLGTPYTLSGPVIHGKGIGKSEMQYPTMNIEVSDDLILPPYGVYAVRACIYQENVKGGKPRRESNAAGEENLKPDTETVVNRQGQKSQAVPAVREVKGIANLGERPTVHGSVEGGTRLRLEVHSFDEIGDVYGAKVRVELLKFIRPEHKFDSIAELVTRITEHDIPETRDFFGLS